MGKISCSLGQIWVWLILNSTFLVCVSSIHLPGLYGLVRGYFSSTMSRQNIRPWFELTCLKCCQSVPKERRLDLSIKHKIQAFTKKKPSYNLEEKCIISITFHAANKLSKLWFLFSHYSHWIKISFLTLFLCY